MNPNDVLESLTKKDDGGRTPLDIACFMNYKNIVCYLLCKIGRPSQFVSKDYDIDNKKRNCFHILAYKGNVESMATVLNYDRECLKKTMADIIVEYKKRSKLKSLDIC
jgi:ankyrin repeat protein